MINHDYECSSCRAVFEASVEVEERQLNCYICRTGKANRVYRHFTGINNPSKGRFPRFDTQLGLTLESSQHMERVAKERGLVPMGVEEFNRSRNAPKTPHPFDSDEPSPEFIEQAKRDWDDVKYDRVPKEVEEARVMEAVKESDFLDVKDAPVVKGA